MTAQPKNYETIILARDGGQCDLILNRPERRNSLTHQMMEEIGDAVMWLAGQRDVRVLVIRGAGGAFCAGGDLQAMSAMPPLPGTGKADPLYAPYRYFGYVLERLNRLPQAVVAVVEGAAAGGGFGMAVCADVTLVHKDVKFAIPEPRVGFIPSQVIPFITRRIGEGAMRRLAVTGATVRGEEAVSLGIAHYCCADETALEERLAAVLADIAAMEPEALAAVKSLVLDCAEQTDSQVMDGAAEALTGLLRRPEAAEGIQAFLDKNRPAWAR